MDISLFTSPFFRDSCCLYPFLNSSRSCLGCKKTHGFVQCYTEWDHPRKKKRKIVYLNLALSHEGCDVPVIWWARLFGQNKPFFFYIFNICVCVFCGECAVSVWLASVWMNQLWLLWTRAMNDYMAHICIIIICITPHISVWLLTYQQQSVWMSGHISECLAIRVCTWVCISLHIQSNSLFVLLKLFLLYFLVVK